MNNSNPIVAQFDDTENPYVVEYIRRCRENDTIEAPDATLAGAFLPILETLCQEHRVGGKEAVAIAINRLNLLADTSPVRFKIHERQLYHVSELKNFPKPKYLLEDVIPDQSLVVLYGPSGAGKTFIALDYAFKIARNYPVVYLAAEGKSGYQNRIKAIEEHFGVDTQNSLLNFGFDSINFCNREEVSVFVELMRPKNPKVLVIDTLARNMIGDENSSRDMGEFINNCHDIISQLKLTIIVIHHTGKKGGDARGSSALRGAADMMIGLRNNDGVIELYCDKSKDAPEFAKRYFRLEQIQLDDAATSCVVVPSERMLQADQNQLTNSQREVLETLALPIFFDAGAKGAAILADVSIAQSTLNRVLSQLKISGLIRQSQKGDPYFITDEGRQAIEPSKAGD